MDIREPLLGVTFEPRDEASSLAKVHESRKAALWNDQIAVVWGANWVGKIDLKEVREGTNGPGKKAPVRREADRKRAREEEEEVDVVGAEKGKVDIRTTRRYQPLVLFDFVGQGELVAVERTWFDLSRGLVEAFAKSGEFGT
jgi:U3 small nucleolar RNA-associated protein 4